MFFALWSISPSVICCALIVIKCFVLCRILLIFVVGMSSDKNRSRLLCYQQIPHSLHQHLQWLHKNSLFSKSQVRRLRLLFSSKHCFFLNFVPSIEINRYRVRRWSELVFATFNAPLNKRFVPFST